jgi:hypothetical protein
MNKSVFKAIFFGVLFGAFVFFTGPLIFIVLLLKFIFTPFGMGRMMFYNRGMGGHHFGHRQFAFAENIRNMNEEEYASFKSKMQNPYQHYCGNKNEKNSQS